VADRFHEEGDVTSTDQLIDEKGLTDCERRAVVVIDEADVADEDGIRNAEAWVRARRDDACGTAVDLLARMAADRDLADDIVTALADAALLAQPGASARPACGSLVDQIILAPADAHRRTLPAPVVGTRAPALGEVAETIA
jgi:hypothetical protein